VFAKKKCQSTTIEDSTKIRPDILGMIWPKNVHSNDKAANVCPIWLGDIGTAKEGHEDRKQEPEKKIKHRHGRES
jgi:hypothetical protein